MQRLDLQATQPGIYEAMYKLKGYIATTGIDPLLLELIYIRASQMNACAFCLNMHAVKALELGESAQRIFLSQAWRETNLYTAEERVVLAFTEEVTNIAEGGLLDATYAAAVAAFGEERTAQLLMAVITINSWNRLMASAKTNFQ